MSKIPSQVIPDEHKTDFEFLNDQEMFGGNPGSKARCSEARYGLLCAAVQKQVLSDA